MKNKKVHDKINQNMDMEFSSLTNELYSKMNSSPIKLKKDVQNYV